MPDVLMASENVQVATSMKGGTVTHFTVDEKPILYPLEESAEKSRGGIPLCAPWYGQSARGEKKHGHLRDLWSKGYNKSGPQTVCFPFNRREEEKYPWELSYGVYVSIIERGLTVKLIIKRMPDGNPKSASILPAFHPYFACSDASQVVVRIGDEQFSGFSDQARILTHNLAEDPVGLPVKIEMPGRTITMGLGGQFPFGNTKIVLWSDAPNRYICVEPVFGDPSCFDTSDGYHLADRESIELSMSLSVQLT